MAPVCKYCGKPVVAEQYFCPFCGKKLKNPPVSMSLRSLVWLFVLSTILPPLGIGLTIRYIKAEDEKAKRIGWISLIVTAIAVVVMVLLSISAMNSATQQINSQMQNYQF